MSRAILMALVLTVAALPANAQLPDISKITGIKGSPLKGILRQASDLALDKLSKPGAFAADDAIRIALPGKAKALNDVLKMATQAGLVGDISGDLNNAAGIAASAAKPIFRSAIDKMTLQDAAGVITGGGTGATDYLKRSAGDQVKAQLKPLVRAALGKTGVLAKTQKLAALGVNSDSLVDYVTGKTADGIFTYVGREETQIRANPLSLLTR